MKFKVIIYTFSFFSVTVLSSTLSYAKNLEDGWSDIAISKQQEAEAICAKYYIGAMGVGNNLIDIWETGWGARCTPIMEMKKSREADIRLKKYKAEIEKRIGDEQWIDQYLKDIGKGQ